jgi:hypothetical protein
MAETVVTIVQKLDDKGTVVSETKTTVETTVPQQPADKPVGMYL